MLLGIPEVHSFLLMSSVPLCEHITLCLSIHLLMDISISFQF